jgi:LmbE family N-acetylglucosaminyl deacetylase
MNPAPTSYEALARAWRVLLQSPTPPAGTPDLPKLPALPHVPDDAPVCLLFSPHPDDEAITGGLALRLRQASGWRVVNVAVTLGSRLERRAERWAELQDSCQVLGFELVAAGDQPGQGLEGVRAAQAEGNTPAWQAAVARIARLLAHYQPQAVVCPHALDGHEVHIATSLLVQQALQMSPHLRTHLLLSEYWNTQLEPRLMVELSDADVGRLMQATAMHVGEVARNPYHLSLPAWLIESARRGAERVGGQGAAASGVAFAALYGWQYWEGGIVRDMPRRVADLGSDLGELFQPGPTCVN